MTSQVAVLGYARTPFGRFGGALKHVGLPTLGAVAVRGALARAQVDARDIEELALGVNFPGADRSVARQVQLRAGIPDQQSSYTVDRACCSSLAAISMASRGIRTGDTSLAIAGGVDNLSMVPFFVQDLRWGHRLGEMVLTDQLVIACPHTGVPRAVQAGEEAALFGVGREEQDAWALRSQQRYAAALQEGVFDEEIVPVDVVDRHGDAAALDHDEVPRPDTTAERLAGLKTVYGSPTVTPGNAPDLSSGASALVLASPQRAEALGRPAQALLEGWAMASGEPQTIASIPAAAARRALERTGLSLEDIDLIEINEAFAAVPLVTTLVLADGDQATAERLRERTNVNGGAIAIGHPTGATAARLVMTMIASLRRRGGGTGLVTLCGGIAEAEAVIVRVPPA